MTYTICAEITIYIDVDNDAINQIKNHNDYDDDMERACSIARENVYKFFKGSQFEYANMDIIEVNENA